MSTYDIAGISILEVSCGLGIPFLIASARGVYHTASDHHPFTTRFLFENSRLNNLKPIRFQRCDWADTLPEGGLFDLIIGSDLLYEPAHPALLSQPIDLHSSPSVKVIIIDPGRLSRGNSPAG